MGFDRALRTFADPNRLGRYQIRNQNNSVILVTIETESLPFRIDSVYCSLPAQLILFCYGSVE